MSENSSRQHNNVEMDILDLFILFWRKKKTILMATCLITIVFFIYILTVNDQYIAKGVIKVGSYKNSLNDSVQLDSTNELVRELNVVFIGNKVSGTSEKAYINKIDSAKGSSAYIDISAYGLSNELAAAKISEVVEYIRKKHEMLLHDVLEVKKLELANIIKAINNLENNQLEYYDELIKVYDGSLKDVEAQLASNVKIIRNNKNTNLSVIETIENNNLISLKSELETKIVETKAQKMKTLATELSPLLERKRELEVLLDPNSYQNTDLIGEIAVKNKSDKPKRLKLTAAVFFLSLIFTMVTVVFAHLARHRLSNYEK